MYPARIQTKQLHRHNVVGYRVPGEARGHQYEDIAIDEKEIHFCTPNAEALDEILQPEQTSLCKDVADVGVTSRCSSV